MADVNPPPQIVLPPELAKDAQTRAYFQQLDRFLLQLWFRTGGADDLLDDLVNESNGADLNAAYNIGQLQALKDRIELLEGDLTPAIDLSPKFNSVRKTTDYTLTDWEDVSACGNITLTLPSNPSDGAEYIIGNEDGGIKTISGNGKKIRRKLLTESIRTKQKGTRIHLRYKIDVDEYLLI